MNKQEREACDRMMAICCTACDVTREVFFSKSRRSECVIVRHAFAYNMQKAHKTDVVLTKLGQYMGCDHSTVINGRDKWDDLLSIPHERGIKRIQQRIESLLPKTMETTNFVPLEERIQNILHQKEWAKNNGHAHIVNVCLRELNQLSA